MYIAHLVHRGIIVGENRFVEAETLERLKKKEAALYRHEFSHGLLDFCTIAQTLRRCSNRATHEVRFRNAI
jgi:hypothetical protein